MIIVKTGRKYKVIATPINDKYRIKIYERFLLVFWRKIGELDEAKEIFLQ